MTVPLVRTALEEEKRLVKAFLKAHNKALDLFRRGAVAAKDAGHLLNTLMKVKGIKTRDELWRWVLQEAGLSESQFSYRSCAAYMKTAADWEWMEALLGDELYSMTQNGFLAEAAKLRAKSRRKEEPVTATDDDADETASDDEGDEGDEGDETPAGSEDEGDEGQGGIKVEQPPVTGGGSGEPGPGKRHVDPVIVLTNLCNALHEIVEADDLKDEEKPQVEELIEKALKLIEELRKRCAKQ